jgi:RNA polymerase sigma factor (sigma-70 family)
MSRTEAGLTPTDVAIRDCGTDPLALYKNELGPKPVWSLEQDLAWYFQMQAGKGLLADKETIAQAQLAREQLVTSHARLPLKFLTRLLGCGASTEDLIGAGNLGLSEAADKWNPFLKGEDQPISFSTYAYWWVFNEMVRAVSGANTIRVPEYMQRLMLRVRSQELEHLQATGENITDEELCATLGISPVRLNWIRRAFQETHTATLDAVISVTPDGHQDEDDTGDKENILAILRAELKRLEQQPAARLKLIIRLQRLIQSDGSDNPEIIALLKSESDRYLAQLDQQPDARLDRIMTLILEGNSYTEIGERFALSRERIRQLQQRAVDFLVNQTPVKPPRRASKYRKR